MIFTIAIDSIERSRIQTANGLTWTSVKIGHFTTNQVASNESDSNSVLFVCVSAGGGCEVDNGGCEHLCIAGNDGHFYCQCQPGFRLRTDGRTCQGRLSQANHRTCSPLAPVSRLNCMNVHSHGEF